MCSNGTILEGGDPARTLWAANGRVLERKDSPVYEKSWVMFPDMVRKVACIGAGFVGEFPIQLCGLCILLNSEILLRCPPRRRYSLQMSRSPGHSGRQGQEAHRGMELSVAPAIRAPAR